MREVVGISGPEKNLIGPREAHLVSLRFHLLAPQRPGIRFLFLNATFTNVFTALAPPLSWQTEQADGGDVLVLHERHPLQLEGHRRKVKPELRALLIDL